MTLSASTIPSAVLSRLPEIMEERVYITLGRIILAYEAACGGSRLSPRNRQTMRLEGMPILYFSPMGKLAGACKM